MKVYLFLLFLVVQFFTINAKAQNVFPIYSDSAKWSVAEWYWYDVWTKKYQYDYDTTFCGHTYSKITISPYMSSAYFRSDSLRTYFRYGSNCLDKEYLIYDFSLNVGDKVYPGYEVNLPGFSDTLLFRLESVDTLIYMGVDRIRFKMRYYINYPYDTSYYRIMYWLKGIGSLMHPFYSLKCMQDGCESHYDLLCYDSLGVQLYQDMVYNTCDTTTIGIDVPQNKVGFRVYPNPIVDYFNVFVENQANYSEIELIIYDIQVREVKRICLNNLKNRNIVDVHGLKSGVYFVSLFLSGKLLGTKKIVVMEER
ncbi:MAG: hypothetical protein DRI84_02790 [Bacteroidetes bacterium]|nr:MAG: hypothetical protein DRI84_02790 [Bacteroidota bacterium]